MTAVIGGTSVTVSSVVDFATLEAKWRDLESRAEPSFFQSWTWTGCLAEDRFPHPVLVEALDEGRTVALALFNRRGRNLYLGESGVPALDCAYIEFNGVLAESGRERSLTVACLTAARRGLAGVGKPHLILSGIDPMTADASTETGQVHHVRSLPAPSIDLSSRNECFIDSRSSNTRQQIRRSRRGYASSGDIRVDRADTLNEAYEFLDRLSVLHQTSWVGRGQPGAFANPFFGRFHRELIARGLRRGEIDLIRVTAGDRIIGYLYNFRFRGRSLAYQSGFDYADANRNEKPGLTCHFEAIRFAGTWGVSRYDFLAGDARYKRSLSNQVEMLHWIEVAGPFSPRFLARRAYDLLRNQRYFPVRPGANAID